MLSRRRFGQTVLASLPASIALGQSSMNGSGVKLGVCTYSFRDLPPDPGASDAVGPVLRAMQACGATECELFSPQLEPEDPAMTAFLKKAAQMNGDSKAISAAYRKMQTGPEAKERRESLRKWRLSTPMEHFTTVRNQFDKAGVKIYAYTINFGQDYTDQELDACFRQTQALGVKIIASSTTLSVAPRLAPFAEKYKIYVTLHGHSNKGNPDDFSTPETFAQGLKLSPYFRVNLDIGHFHAAGFDPVPYIEQNHQIITHLHIKDRKADDGPNEPFGQGDTPIKPVLMLLKQKKYPIPAFVEYEYKGAGTPVQEVKACLSYMKQALA